MSKLTFLLGAAALGLSAQANAATLISLGYQAGGTGPITTLATDGGTGQLFYSDNDASDGLTGTINAIGAPALSQPNLQTNQLSLNSAGARTVAFYLTLQGLSNPGAASALFQSAFTANSFTGNVVSVIETTFVSATNALYGGTQLATRTFTGLGRESSIDSANTGTGLYSETAKYLVTFGAGTSSVNNTVNIAAVPEPASWTMMLAGFGFAGLALRQRRRPAVTFG